MVDQGWKGDLLLATSPKEVGIEELNLRPSEANTYADIEAVYQCLQTEYGVIQVGHTTAVSKACKVVESGFAQCHPLWVSCPVPCEVLFLFRRNIRKIRNMKCPVLVIHPSEANTYADIEAVYQCLQTKYGVSQEDLILYGQSVGSGPTLHLSAKLPRLSGMVLHSAILAGLHVLCHM